MSDHLARVLTLLDDALSLNGRSATFTVDTPLLGSLPELDSMAVASLLTAIEETKPPSNQPAVCKTMFVPAKNVGLMVISVW